MPTGKKPPREEVKLPFQDTFDAKITSYFGDFVIVAHRIGEKEPTSVLVLTRKADLSDKEKGFVIKRSEVATVRAGLAHFEDMVSKLDNYGKADTTVGEDD
jgi:hypothetical protein